MAVTAAQFKARIHEFAASSDASVDAFLAEAARRINAAAWSAKADDGLIQLTAHLMKVAALGSGAAVGAVVSEKVGAVSRSYAAPTDVDTDYATTAYGRAYLSLLRTIFVPRF